MVQSCVCHAATRCKGNPHGWGLKLTFEAPIQRKSRPHFCPRFLHAMADTVTQSLRSGPWQARIPGGVALGVCSFSAQRSSGLGGSRPSRAEAFPWDRSTPRYRKSENGNAVFVTAQAPNKSMDAGTFTTYMLLECPALTEERNRENPASSGPQSGPFLEDQCGPPDCTHRCAQCQ